jgi:hypothetical protein
MIMRNVLCATRVLTVRYRHMYPMDFSTVSVLNAFVAKSLQTAWSAGVLNRFHF